MSTNEQLREMLAEMERAAEVLRQVKQRNEAAPRQQLTAMKPIGAVVAVVIKQIDEMEKNLHGTR